MTDDASAGEPAPQAPGRPFEIELASNLRLIHPISHALVDRLIPTPVTPNAVSVSSVFAAAVGCACYALLPWPWSAPVGLVFMLGWHVLDGADGDLARRTGRASPLGLVVDGVCDHLSQTLVYVAFGWLLLAGPFQAWAVPLGVLAGVSHFFQATVYETSRKIYRHHVYGAASLQQGLPLGRGAQAVVARAYLTVAAATNPGEEAIEAAMGPLIAAGGVRARAARELYRELYVPVVKVGGWLSSNNRTFAAALSILIGSPIWYLLYEIVALNLVSVGLTLWRRRRNARLIEAIARGG